MLVKAEDFARAVNYIAQTMKQHSWVMAPQNRVMLGQDKDTGYLLLRRTDANQDIRVLLPSEGKLDPVVVDERTFSRVAKAVARLHKHHPLSLSSSSNEEWLEIEGTRIHAPLSDLAEYPCEIEVPVNGDEIYVFQGLAATLKKATFLKTSPGFPKDLYDNVLMDIVSQEKVFFVASTGCQIVTAGHPIHASSSVKAQVALDPTFCRNVMNALSVPAPPPGWHHRGLVYLGAETLAFVLEDGLVTVACRRRDADRTNFRPLNWMDLLFRPSSILPKGPGTEVMVKKKPLAQFLKLLEQQIPKSFFSQSSSIAPAVKLEVNGDYQTLIVSLSPGVCQELQLYGDGASISRKFEASQGSGPSVTAYFNVKYLREALEVAGFPEVKLTLYAPEKPMKIEEAGGGENYTCVLMPVV